MPRGNKFKVQYTKEFKCIVAGKDQYHAHCTSCGQEIELSSTGKPAITRHCETEKHKKATKFIVENRTISAFVTPKWTADDEKIAAAEGAWSYHIAKHGQSFLSADCVSSGNLFESMFPDSKIAERFSSAQKKTAKIITNILGPYSVEKVLAELGDKPFSIAIDASNHGEDKMFPIVIRYFEPTTGIRLRLLDFAVLPGEDAELVHKFIVNVLQKHNLSFDNLTSFCADNAPVNFGGPQLKGNNNVFHHLKAHQKNLIPIGCPAHILHNAAKTATDRLSIDIEAVAFKIQSFFKGSTKRHEALKEVFETADKKDSLLPQMIDVIETFRFKIQDRKRRKFYGAKTTESLKTLPSKKRDQLVQDFDDFYSTIEDYIHKWYKFEQLPTKLKWILMDGKTVEYEEVVELAHQVAPTIAENDALFDEVTALNRVIQQIRHEELKKKTLEQIWEMIFANGDFPCLLTLISKIFSIPVSNAFIETVFSLAKIQWTDSRNLLLPATVKSLLQVKVNFDGTCSEMYFYLLGNKTLLKKISGGEKYN